MYGPYDTLSADFLNNVAAVADAVVVVVVAVAAAFAVMVADAIDDVCAASKFDTSNRQLTY